MYSRALISTDRKYKMKIGFTFWLLLATTCLSTGCVWRSAHYDPETGIVHGGGFDCFHRRWFNNMRDDLREYRCNSCNQCVSGGMGGCDDCSDQGGTCGRGHEGPYLPRRSRHYGSDWSNSDAHRSYEPYEVYDDGEYIEGDYVEGEYFGESVHEGEVIHNPSRRSASHGDDCPHCRKQNRQPRQQSQTYAEPQHRQEQFSEREGWQEVSPDEYHNSANAAPYSNSPPSSAPPVSIDTGAMTTIPQRSPRLSAPPTSHAPAAKPLSTPSTDSTTSQPQQWSPPQPNNGPSRSFNDASSMKWVPSRL